MNGESSEPLHDMIVMVVHTLFFGWQRKADYIPIAVTPKNTSGLTPSLNCAQFVRKFAMQKLKILKIYQI